MGGRQYPGILLPRVPRLLHTKSCIFKTVSSESDSSLVSQLDTLLLTGS